MPGVPPLLERMAQRQRSAGLRSAAAGMPCHDESRLGALEESAQMQQVNGSQPMGLSERASSWLVATLLLAIVVLSASAVLLMQLLEEHERLSQLSTLEILGITTEDLIVGALFAWVAKIYRRHLFVWFVSGVVLGPLLTLALLVITPSRADQGLSWQCPKCRQFNEPNSHCCPCGQPVEAEEEQGVTPPDEGLESQSTVVLMLTVAVLYGLAYHSSALLVAVSGYGICKYYQVSARHRIARSSIFRADRALALALCVVVLVSLAVGTFEVDPPGTENSDLTAWWFYLLVLPWYGALAIWGLGATLFRPKRSTAVLHAFLGRDRPRLQGVS